MAELKNCFRIAEIHGVSTPGVSRDERRQRERIRWVGFVLASYAVDTLFLALFALAGTIGPTVPLAYGLGAACVSAASYLFHSSSWGPRFDASRASAAEMVVAVLLQSMVVWLAPQIAFPYLANLLTVLSFGALQLTLRQFALVWLVGCAGAGIAIAAHGGQLGIPAAGSLELLLVWLYFTTVLGRCVLISVAAQSLRRKLDDSRNKLAIALGQVQQLAIRDELTGAFNRRHMMERLREESARFERTGQAYCVAMLDLDHFKSINDTHGHGAGDAVLRQFARIASETIRTTDLFGRYGGEEFLLLMTATTQAMAVQAVERIRMRLHAADWAGIAPGLNVTVSIGVAESCGGCTTEALLHEADQALYQAKRSGRNRVEMAPSRGN